MTYLLGSIVKLMIRFAKKTPAAAIAAVGAVAVVGCGSGAKKGHGTSTTAAPSAAAAAALKQAVKATVAAKGYAASFSGSEARPSGTVNVTGNGSFTPDTKSASVQAQVGLPSTGYMQLQAVMANGTDYIKVPSQYAAQIPGGKPWVKIKTSELGKLTNLPGGAGTMLSNASSLQPAQLLNVLKAAGSVANSGSQTVSGVATTEYKVMVEPQKLAGAAPAAQRGALAPVLQAVGNKPLPVYVWVDQQNMIRQLSGSQQFSPKGATQPFTVQIKLDLTGFGKQPKPTLPPASQALDLGPLVSSGLI